MQIPHAVDSHVHIGDAARIEELKRFVELLCLERLGCISLPTVGAGAAGTLINFNPEVLLAVHALPGVADGFGSFDNRGLLASTGGVAPGRPAGVAGTPPGAAGAGSRPGAKGQAWAPAAQVEAMHEAGFGAIKMWEGKPDLQAALGITLDDPRLIEAYQEAGRRGMPVLIHVADPQLFWEREGGPWSYVGRPVPSFEELIRQAAAVCEKAAETTFVFPHLLFLADDPPRMGRVLEEHPNCLMDLAPGNYFYPALGAAASVTLPAAPRRREEAIAFFEAHAPRIMLGSDAFFLPRDLALLPGTPLTDNLERYLRLRRFLGSEDCFATPYGATAEEAPLICGLGLPRELLSKIGGENYIKLMGPARRPNASAAERYLERWAGGEPAAEARAAAVAERIGELAPPGKQ